MKIDTQTIAQLLSLPDEKMMQVLTFVAGSAGFKTQEKTVDPATVRKLRAVLTEITDADIDRAGYLLGLYQKTK